MTVEALTRANVSGWEHVHGPLQAHSCGMSRSLRFTGISARRASANFLPRGRWHDVEGSRRGGIAMGAPLSSGLFGVALLSVFAAAPASVVDGQRSSLGTSARTWVLVDQRAQPLLLRLVRGSARIVRRGGPLKIELRRHSKLDDPGRVSFIVKKDARSITITDRYPYVGGSGDRECLPPDDDRGHFWGSDIVVDAVIYAPPGLRVTAEIMDARLSG
ncbi:MAG TPA: hypothetical protein VE968_04660 [Sphingomicrobium sp.]|nr:hypothetical protein [Sphingomicrobium sp.]